MLFFPSRYIFKSEKKVGIQELGPRFTLKLRSLQKGTFDSKFGEYEWVHKVCLSNTRPAWEGIINLTLNVTTNLSLKKAV